MIRLTLSITAARGESWRLIDALRSLMVPTRRERGCLSCQLVLSSESSDPARISYSEDWSSEEALREQVRSERFSRLLELMECASETPQLQFQLPGRRPRARLRRGSACRPQPAHPGDPASINPDEP